MILKDRGGGGRGTLLPKLRMPLRRDRWQLVQDRSCVGGDADPVSVFQDPGIDKALATNVGLAVAAAFGGKDSDGDGGLTVDVHGHRFGSDLFFVGGG